MTTPTTTVADYAARYANAGLRVLPIRSASKHPSLTSWATEATTDPETVAQWFPPDSRHNIGLALGDWDGDGWLFAVDVDTHKGDGFIELRQLVEQHAPLPVTWEQHTPSGGMHLVYRSPVRLSNSAKRLPPNIDVRGAGGQIVAAPSTVNGKPYRWTDGRAPWDIPVADAPTWLVELLTTPEPERTRTTTVERHNSPADRLRDTWDWPTELARQGWQPAKDTDRRYWVRPGKNPADGHSAVLHDGGPLVVFTTEISPALQRLGKPTADGSGRSFSPFDWYTAHHHDGDTRAASRALNGDPFDITPPGNVDPATGELIDTTPPSTLARHREPAPLPGDWWTQRDTLQHIATLARSRRVAPTALLGCALTRLAALTPPTCHVPGYIGGSVPLSTFVALVAHSGGGKSTPMAAARDLFGPPPATVAGPLSLGSGEGLVEAYLGTDIDELTGQRVQRFTGVEFTIDEGAAFVEQSARAGATLAPTMCSAWSGYAIGQTLARKETSRHLPARAYTIGVVGAWQPSTLAGLLDLASLGLPQRWLYLPTVDPDAPRRRPADPGPLDWQPPDQPLTWSENIDHDVDHEAWLIDKGLHKPDPLDAHLTLTQLKTAALLAVLDNRTHVDDTDFALAADIVAASRHTLRHAQAVNAHERRAREHAANDRAARRELHVADEREKRATLAMARAIARRAHRHPNTTFTTRQLRDACKGSDRQNGSLDDAFHHATEQGWIVADGDQWRAGGSQPKAVGL